MNNEEDVIFEPGQVFHIFTMISRERFDLFSNLLQAAKDVVGCPYDNVMSTFYKEQLRKVVEELETQ